MVSAKSDNCEVGILQELLSGDGKEDRPLEKSSLVAVKIIELTSSGGASRERIESGLKREVDILKNLNHPCLIHLIAFNLDTDKALIVLPYCRGGDLFDLATSSRRVELLQPATVKRLFGEIVSAVLYLHNNLIVHRDLKLENVLMNATQDELLSAISKNDPITTLTDFGLSRRIDPENPMLTTRCGSEDYAPPELIMGQPYDGRQTDTWALGVLLYALMEGRFPFDPPPDMTGSTSSYSNVSRSRVKHRIARIDWSWYKFRSSMDEWIGAKRIVEMCLQRKDSRATLQEIWKTDWVQDGVRDLKF
ncbi:kinase-like domain-containing protein [Dipodascopsis uninucleata]